MISSNYMRLVLHCGLAEAVEMIGERWAFLILRGVFNGLTRFEEFQQTLGIARNILSNRLAKLVEHGILVREPDQVDRRRADYRLTEKGEALLPVMIALRQWGENWGANGPLGPVLVDIESGRPVRQMRVLAEDGRPLDRSDLNWVDRDSIAAS